MTMQAMITTISLLDLTNDHQGWTDYQIAQWLDVKTGVVSTWRTGKSVMSDRYVDKFAELLGFDTKWLLLHIHAERHLKQPFFNDLKELAEEKTPSNIIDMLERVRKLDKLDS